MKDLSLLPNKEGFEFIAVLKNGDIVKSKVIKDENGVHRFPEFSNSIGWLDLKIKAFRNRNTVSIDWRGNHGLVERWKQKALEMEKKQIKDAWLSAWKDSMLNPLSDECYQELADEYFKQKY